MHDKSGVQSLIVPPVGVVALTQKTTAEDRNAR